MTYVIAEPCIDVKDKACIDACPMDCIAPKDDPVAPQLYIDPTVCIDCGCCLPVCPVSAIFRAEDLPERWAHFAQVNAEWWSKHPANAP